MEKKTAGLLGALAGFAAMGSAQAATNYEPNVADTLHVSSYAELLTPIPNAVALLKASDALLLEQANQRKAAGVQQAQYYYQQDEHHHHHHHHHQEYVPPPPPPPEYGYDHHHHHHHHQQGVVIFIPGVGYVRAN
ncbi:MAG: hypothetical protein B7Z75_00465 [Acidocella sp. 20-57-95]|nr:MAG: hypothetical protein B7Z75_00465 [Acidocella sp. 20-57-95]OYV59655.1 MAG: hypothetical protein B7Z71_07625 [Acidocella sp. 21-58-7]HQT63291.1 hypothetical protein [Acidocella sp.]HQU03559.1 hypothetical protein [Acidocella sp.]